VDGEDLEVSVEDLDVRAREREGFVAEAGRGDVVVLDAHVDDTLRREGLAREIVHHVQQARREAGLVVEQRIELTVSADGEVGEAVREHRDTIAEETLATVVRNTEPTDGHRKRVELDGQIVTIGLVPTPR
jgi:isoleucyl-tRNA synthetase